MTVLRVSPSLRVQRPIFFDCVFEQTELEFQFVHVVDNRVPIPGICRFFHLRCKLSKRFATDACRGAFDGVGLPRGARIISTFHKFVQGLDLMRNVS